MGQGRPQLEGDGHVTDVRLPRVGRPLAPLVNLAARLNTSVHTKLLSGFLFGALLLLGMGILSLVVIGRMSDRVRHLERLEQRADWSNQMIYAVTSQSHFRAMALLTRDDSNNEKIAAAKQTFADLVDKSQTAAGPENASLFALIRDANDRYTRAGETILAQYKAGDIDSAMRSHLALEHPISHELEAAMRELIASVDKEMSAAQIAFEADRQLLSAIVLIFSFVSLAAALALGFVLSWAFILPVRRIDLMLARIAAGDFAQRVDVPNRDEFGTLSRNLNSMSEYLAGLYEELRRLNEGLQQKVREQVREIERSRMLRRYLPQQVADAVIASGDESLLQTHRREITVVFGDLRGFTAFSETAEPEVVMGVLREYHGAVGELISRYSGTLEHFAGDGWMVYFNDPLPVPDHQVQAVRMAVAMRERVAQLSRGWRKLGYELDFGIGIAVGFATLGTIGFEGRHDYGAVGAVGNLASRLSSEAKGGQILVSQRVQALVEDLGVTEPVGALELKGFSRPVIAYNVVSLHVAAALGGG
jgi:class 3 adenylate cyclase/CHASE3 domain sensor protein